MERRRDRFTSVSIVLKNNIIYRRKEVDIMAQTRNYASKKKGKTEVYPFWNLEDIKNMIDWFINHKEWDGYLITMLELLLERPAKNGASFNRKFGQKN